MTYNGIIQACMRGGKSHLVIGELEREIMSTRETMELLDRVIFHLTTWRVLALEAKDIDGWQHYDQCVWLVRKIREAKSFDLL